MIIDDKDRQRIALLRDLFIGEPVDPIRFDEFETEIVYQELPKDK